MGLGPRGTSLLHKLGKLQAWEMSYEELRELVHKDRERRTIARAMGRLTAMLKDESGKKKRSEKPSSSRKPKASAKVVTLESLGLDPLLITGLRKSGKSDTAIIKSMQEKGLL